MNEKPPPYNTVNGPYEGMPTQPGFNPPPTQPGFNPPPTQYPPYGGGGAPPPAPGYAQPPPQAQVIITNQPYDPFRMLRPNANVIHSTPYGNTVILGPNSTGIQCPSCHQQITTAVQSIPTTKTHLFAALMCLFGCWPCCLIPYCMDDCQGRSHTCPNCGAYLGTFEN